MYNQYESATTLGIPERWERVLCYALGWVSGLVLLIIEQRNHNVRRHAAQSIIVFSAISILGWLLSLFSHIWVIGLAFGILGWAVGVAGFGIWILLMVMAYLRPSFTLPFGRTYERMLG